MLFCKLGNRWCPNFSRDGYGDICKGIEKINGEKCANGKYFIGLHTECPYTDKHNTAIKEHLIEQGWITIL